MGTALIGGGEAPELPIGSPASLDRLDESLATSKDAPSRWARTCHHRKPPREWRSQFKHIRLRTKFALGVAARRTNRRCPRFCDTSYRRRENAGLYGSLALPNSRTRTTTRTACPTKPVFSSSSHVS